MKTFRVFMAAAALVLLSFSFADAARVGVLTEEVDSDPAGFAYKLKFPNGSVTLSGGVATLSFAGVGGQAVTLQLEGGDDPESADLGQITVINDTNSIFTESSADVLQIDVSANWPTADEADTLSTALTHELGGLEADVSAYAGLVSITGGATAQVDELAELNALISDATLLDDGAIADSTAIGLAAGDTYSNFGDGDDDSLNEMFAAIDAAIVGGDAFTVKVDAAATAGYLGAANNDGVLRTDGTVITYTDGGDYVTLTAHAYLTDIAGITAAQGDIIYFDGTDWVNLGPGTSGKYLKTQGAGANPIWDTPAGAGDVTAVGSCASGACFTDGETSSTALIWEMTDNDYETTLTAADPTADRTITMPNETGTIMLGPAGLGTDNRIVKTNGTGNIVQITGITVDDSNNVSSVGTLGSGAITSTGNITSGDSFIIGSADIEEAELEILDGATLSTTDINIIDGISDSGSLTAAELLYVDGVTSAIQTQLDARALESVVGTSLNADDLLNNSGVLELQPEIPHLDAAANISAAWEVQDNTAFNFGNGADMGIQWDTDLSGLNDYTLTGEGLKFLTNTAGDVKVVFENTNASYGVDLYIQNLYYTGALTSLASSGDSYIGLANNPGGLDPSGNRIYFETDSIDVLSYSINGSEKRFANLGDNQTYTGIPTFSYDIAFAEAADHSSTPGAGYGYLWVKSDTPSSLYFTDDAGTDYDLTAASAGDVESVGDANSGATFDGSSDGGTQLLFYDADGATTLAVGDNAGAITVTLPVSTGTLALIAGSDTYVTFNDGGVQGGDAGFTFNKTTDALTLGENGQDGSLVLYNESGGTDYTATIQPGTQTANATITLPGSTATVATLGLAETFAGVKTFSVAPVLPADTIDAITEIAAALKSGADATLITGTKGDADDILVWNADGDAVSSGEALSEVVTAARVGAASANLDDTDASVEWEDAGGLDSDGTLSDGAVDAIAVIASGLLGIDDDDLLQVNDADLADNDFLKIDTTGVEGRSASEVMADLVDGEGTAATYALFDDNDGTYSFRAIADGDIPNDITIDSAALADTVTVSDDENTDDAHEVVFTTDNATMESDGDLNYNPSTGTLTATILSNGTVSITGGVLAGVTNFTASGIGTQTPQAKTYQDNDDDDETIGTDLTSSIIAVTGDDDGDNDSIDLQDGTVAGQILMFIAVAGVDSNDTFTIDVETDSTCTGCPDSGIIEMDAVGDIRSFWWSGSAWFLVGVTDGS